MADLYEPDVGTAYYRSNDPLKNLRFRVTLKRITSTSIVPQAQNKSEDDDVELQSVDQKSSVQSDEEQMVILWQEKVFGQREIDLYSNADNCYNVMDQKYFEDVSKLLEKGRPTNRIFSYVDHDSFSNQDETLNYMTSSAKEKPSNLAKNMAHIRRRRIGGRQAKERELGIIPKTNIVVADPSDERIAKNHIDAPPMQVMYIMADLSPREQPASEESENILCSLHVDAHGVLSIRPDFNRGRKAYIIETGTLGKEVFEYTIEHASKPMNRLEQEKEMKMYREVYTRHKEFLQACVGSEFEMPPPDVLRLLVFGELEMAKDFDSDNIYIQFFIDLPKDWYAESPQQLSWVTQTCQLKTKGQNNIAHFGFPFQVELFYKREIITEENKDVMPHFPIIYVEVLSLDSWQRYRTEGYTYFSLPGKPGTSYETQDCWRPLKDSVVSNLRRFFIGGSPELEFPTYTAIPSTFDGSHLSKFGFRTETTGSVCMRFNTMLQSRMFVQKKSNKKSLGALLDNLGITSQQASVASVIEAFKKARLKMLQARESATRTLLKDDDDNENTKKQ
ncbi:hypothetical protein LOTGIDRAFT_228399 [Lottia gigantea]|uniref:Meckel syndrome type 1 protein n=1 Tax=Lottia gigantea TaxID=225164 RepID=V4ASP5_LOTGI|nr:hypothetical protein LOTGIDRAFT_228399 [Lottia gigantea]ESO97860.1 hypothetical protein LOTGIDRAFT_228399 [Lottia gigantea]